MVFRIWLIVSLSALCLSCTGKKASHVSAADSDKLNEVEESRQEIARLRDTIFPSAHDIWWKVDLIDTVNQGSIESLTDLYADRESIMTFRRGTQRQGRFNGHLDSIPSKLVKKWVAETESEKSDTVYGPWGGGTGWTGQPLFVRWNTDQIARLKSGGCVTGNFDGSEIIVGSLCGKLYFISPDDGSLTRNPIEVGNPIKGTPSFDPTFNGFLYVGQGTPAHRPFGAVTVDLFKNNVIDFFREDPKALRRWGAYDSSAIRVGQFVFRPAENGGIYKFLVTDNGPRLHSVLRYKVNGAAPGIEASMAVYSNYGFTADNHGNVLAINLENMQPVWLYRLGDDTDSTPLLAVEDGVPYLYVGCEIDRQPREYAVFAKLNALDGEEIWKIKPEGQRREDGKKHFDGGFYASPLLGEGNCDGLIFTNMVKNTCGSNGVFMAIDRKNGDVKYELPLKCYSWSSPVSFMTKGGKQIVVTADCSGNVYIIDGLKGEIIACERIGSNFESSPLVLENSIIVGSRSNGIYKIALE